MNSVQNNRERSRPQLLVLLFVLAVVSLFVLQYLVSIFLFPFFASSGPLSSMIFSALQFPLWMPCTVWLASRSGRTDKFTWIVPVTMIFLIVSFPLLFAIFQTGGIGSRSFNAYLLIQWQASLKSSILSFVLLSFLFRASSLHLRPVESRASHHRLKVLTIMLLTLLVAVCLSLDALVQRAYGMEFASSFFLGGAFWLLIFVLGLLVNALVWFSSAWLLVSQNRRRWIGVLGLAICLLWSGLINLIVYPMLISQSAMNQQVLMSKFVYYAGLFAINIFHGGIAFLCVGVMQLAGYRWDLYRPLLESEREPEKQVDTEPPPMIVSRIEI